MFTRIIGAAVGLVLALPASGAVLPADLIEVTGADTYITRDTESGLDWLDVNLTKSISFNSLVGGAALSNGGVLNGLNPITGFANPFRHATQIELIALYTNAGIPEIDAGFTEGNFGPVNILKALLSPTGNGGQSTEFLQGIVSPSSNGAHPFGILQECLSVGANCSGAVGSGAFFSGLALSGTGEFDDDATNSAIGHFLVRDTSVVPVPAALPLFLTALAGLGLVARRQARRA